MELNHDNYMDRAITLALRKPRAPFGALVVGAGSGEVLAEGVNSVEDSPTRHGEMVAIDAWAAVHGSHDEGELVLYTTAEPCPMCMGAIIHARVERIVFGTFDVKWGAAGSLYNLAADTRLNHRVEVITGILENPCKKLMQDFFRSIRNRSPDR